MRRVALAWVMAWCGAAGAAVVAWTYTPPAGYVDVSPGVGDLNGDGQAELVFGTTVGQIVAVDGRGQEVWRQEMRGPVCFPPTVADVAGDGAVEVLTMNREGTILCLNGATGDVLWNAALPGGLEWGTTVPATGDVDGDGALEIVTADREGNVVCLRGSGETAWTAKTGAGNALCPAVADLDGDGKAEVLVSGERVPLVCLSSAGKELWRLKEGIGGSPVVYDLDGQGAPEIVIGVDENLLALDAAGKTLWSCKMRREMDSALSVADADGDGQVEIYAADLSGYFACVSPKGQVRWSASVEERVRRSPSIGDVDGDGINEILVAGYSGAVHVFDPEGRLEERVALPGASNATATLAVLGDSGLCAVVPVVSGPVQVLRWPGTKAGAAVLWPEFRYDSRRAGTVPAAAKAPVEVAVDFGPMYVGANLVKVAVDNPEGRTLTVRIEAVRNHGEPSVGAVESSDARIEHQLSYAVPSAEAVDLSFVCTVAEGNKALARRSRTVRVVPFVKEVADASAMLGEVDARLPKLVDRSGLEERVCFLQHKLDGLRERVPGAGTLEEPDRIALRDELAGLLKDAATVRRLAKAAEEAAGTGSTVCVSAANPWAPFGGVEELTEGRAGASDPTVEAFAGETESAALNVFNLSGTARVFRVEMDVLKQGESTVRAAEAVTLHEVLDVPTEMRDFSSDALPRLNDANVLLVPAWGARQLWLNVNTKSLAAGEWAGAVRLRSLDIEPVEAAANLKVTVWNARLPEKQALRNCGWGYVHSSVLKDYPEEALADQVRHGTDVFVANFFPQAKYDEQGNLVGEIDFSAHDAYVKRHAPHGLILFFNYQHALTGPGGQESDVYAKAHVQWLRAWVKHLAELGVGYDGFALYPVDEPGLSDGLVDLYLRMAKLAREADPKILLYTDPVARIEADELRAMLPYVDIWCPNRGGIVNDEENAEKLAIIKGSGETVWTYECEANVKHQSPLGYYRGQAWLAWHHGMTGIGFWSYCTSQDDPWFLPNLRHDYLMIYPGNGVVSSKRWEAVRDGVEDYTLLAALRDAAARPGVSAEDAAAAKRLLGEEASVVGAFCGVDDDGTQPGTDGLPGVRRVEDARWERLQSVRRELAALLTRLQADK